MKRFMIFDVLLIFFSYNSRELCCNAQQKVSVQIGFKDVTQNTIYSKPGHQYHATSSPTSTGNSYNTENCGPQKQNPIRPCPDNDLQCVKDYFQKHSKCKPVESIPSDVVEIDLLRLHIPYLNMSIFQSNVKIGGLNSGRIYDFIVDAVTDIVVLTVSFYNITISGNSEFIYYRSAMEPLSVDSFTSEMYPNLIITSILERAQNLQITDSVHVANVTQLPTYSLGPCITNTQDPTLKSLFANFNTNVKIVIQESFLTRARSIQNSFIRDHICDFGSKYTLNE